MSHSIRTEVVIEANPEAVWAVLTDFASHAEWDPFLVAVEGKPTLGSRLAVRFHNGTTFRPTVTEASEGRALEWLGKLFLSGLFDGRHRFELIPEQDRTRLIHSERFSGLLVPLLKRMLSDAERGFRAFNTALKQRVERPTRRPAERRAE